MYRQIFIACIIVAFSVQTAKGQNCLSGELLAEMPPSVGGTALETLGHFHASFLAAPDIMPYDPGDGLRVVLGDNRPFYICGIEAATYLQSLPPTLIPEYCASLPPGECDDVQNPLPAETGYELAQSLSLINPSCVV